MKKGIIVIIPLFFFLLSCSFVDKQYPKNKSTPLINLLKETVTTHDETTPTEKVFWIYYRPSKLPVVECPDENPENGKYSTSNNSCRISKSFWDSKGKYWGPIIKDDNAPNVDFNCVPPFKCKPSPEELVVYSIDDGIVKNIDFLGKEIGWKIEVEYSNGYVGNFGHISDPHEFAKEGQQVKAGQQIGVITKEYEYFLAFSIHKYIGNEIVGYNPFDFGLTILP